MKQYCNCNYVQTRQT